MVGKVLDDVLDSRPDARHTSRRPRIGTLDGGGRFGGLQPPADGHLVLGQQGLARLGSPNPLAVRPRRLGLPAVAVGKPGADHHLRRGDVCDGRLAESDSANRVGEPHRRGGLHGRVRHSRHVMN